MRASDDKTTKYMDGFRCALGEHSLNDDVHLKHYSSKPSKSGPAVCIEPTISTGPYVQNIDSTWQIKSKLNLSERNLLCMSSNHDEVVVGGADHAVRVLKVSSDGKIILKRTLYSKQYGHSDWVTCVQHLRNGQVVSGGMDSNICVWTGARCKNLMGHVGSISRIRVLNDKYLASSSYDRSLKIWCLTKSEMISSLHGHKGAVLDFRILPDGCLVSAGRDSTIRVWDISQGKQVFANQSHAGAVSALTNTDEGIILSGGQDGQIQLLDRRVESSVDAVRPFSQGAAATHLDSVDSWSFVAIGSDGRVCIFDSRKNILRKGHEWTGDHSSYIYSAFTSLPDRLLTGGGDGTLSVRSRDGNFIKKTPIDSNAIRVITAVASGILVLATDDGNIATL